MKKAFYVAIIMFLCTTMVYSGEKERFDDTLQKAEAGDAESQYRVALSYMFDKRYTEDQKEKEPDYKKALFWLNKSAEKGYAKSQFLLGRLYELGRGTKKDNKRAMYWYKKAADAGEEDAKCSLAKLYSESDVFPKDPEVSRDCFMK